MSPNPQNAEIPTCIALQKKRNEEEEGQTENKMKKTKNKKHE